jgi:hypothetical protein
MKPSSSLADPWPAPTVLPKITQQDNTGDYESEMVIVIGRDAKDVPESEALDYVLGYTAANDVSSRTSQMNQSQWSFSKGFDGACPIGIFIHHLPQFQSIILIDSQDPSSYLLLSSLMLASFIFVASRAAASCRTAPSRKLAYQNA